MFNNDDNNKEINTIISIIIIDTIINIQLRFLRRRSCRLGLPSSGRGPRSPETAGDATTQACTRRGGGACASQHWPGKAPR